MDSRILTLNSGSSSLKFAVYRVGESEERLASGSFDRIGLPGGRFRAESSGGEAVDREIELANHQAALDSLLAWLDGIPEGRGIDAIGHRVVQGGPRLTRPAKIDPDIVAALESFVPLAPNHLPGAIAAMEAARRAYPTLPQIACFDTSFHREMSPLAQRFALPREWFDRGICRYGFHGLSFEYVVGELRRVAGERVGGRCVIAHLGNGASLAAVDRGKAVDTTMGLTPLGGLVMGTRAGDLDPGLVLHLLRQPGMTVDRVEDLLAKQSGLLGVSETSSDMKDLLEREADDPRAAEAVAIFCRQARKQIAAMAAALEGLDTLVFTGGIGERSATIRERIASGLGFLGATIDRVRNAAGAEIVSRDGAPVVVRTIRTNEELMIARHTAAAVVRAS